MLCGCLNVQLTKEVMMTVRYSLCYGLTSHYPQGKENIVHLQRLDNYPSLICYHSENQTMIQCMIPFSRDKSQGAKESCTHMMYLLLTPLQKSFFGSLGSLSQVFRWQSMTVRWQVGSELNCTLEKRVGGGGGNEGRMGRQCGTLYAHKEKTCRTKGGPTQGGLGACSQLPQNILKIYTYIFFCRTFSVN